MVLCQEQDVLLCTQAHQGGSHERTLSEVEGLPGFFQSEALGFDCSLSLWEIPEVHYGQCQSESSDNDVHWLRFHHCEGGTQDFVAAHDFVEALLQDRHIERTTEADADGNVIHGTVGLQLVEKPEPLLGKGERQVSFSCDRHKGWKQGGCDRICLAQQ